MTNQQFYGPNAGYVLELYDRYLQDPSSVDPETREMFRTWTPPQYGTAPAAVPVASGVDVMKVVGAARLARLTRELGHLAAQIDPLGTPPPGDPELELSTQGLTEADLAALPASIVGGPLAEGAANALEATRRLQQTYCSNVGYDFDQVNIPEERDWLRQVIESREYWCDDAEDDRRLLDRLTQVESFERFLHRSFPGQKWFSIEGLDMLVPMLDETISEAAACGVHEIVMGTAHRGRLNILAHILGQPYEEILAQFVHSSERKGGTAPSDTGDDSWSGDVKYHLGATRRLTTEGTGGVIPVTLAPNPSHLEFVDPVVEGRARAAQEQRDRPGAPLHDPRVSLAVLIHGDAAFIGQGVVAETLNLSRVPGYATGGTIHIIANNQLGFTTDPREDRSTTFASDLAKGFEIPIVHVNADDPAACLMAARLAVAYRQRFRKDVLIDLVGYRRYGHNESDEPAFTQPVMYARIAGHPTVRETFATRLIESGAVTEAEVEAMVSAAQDRLREAHQRAGAGSHRDREHPAGQATPGGEIEQLLPAETLRELNEALLARPEGFTPNAKLDRLLQRRRQSLESGGIDWAHAESLAFASILADGTPIRLTGQDTERGTFSQRHLVLHDPNTGERYVPLDSIPQARASFAVHNSTLSENAVLGFEYGYSMHAPQTLVLWEAQFGDFANGAQVIIDQFISAGRAKWRQQSGLVLLLPHGYEGQGPEHSSGRLERFLQLAAQDNMRVANVTTSAQYYHILRRQAALLGVAPRPLVVMTPKSLLRHPRAASSLEELTDAVFQPLLTEEMPREAARSVTRVLLCSGKVHVDLAGSPVRETASNVAIIRVEELYPFPGHQLRGALAAYPNLEEVVWVQEEPRNMGAWGYMGLRLGEVLPAGIPLGYVGRPESASPAEGSLDAHNAQQERIVRTALAGQPDLLISIQREGVKHAR